jgi:hypothetical protein
MRMDNREALSTFSTQDTGQINVRENRGGNQEWTIQRHWQHWVRKTQDKQTLEKTEWTIKNGQSRDTVNIEYTRHRLLGLCLVYSMLTVSLDCPFLIVHWVFSSVYLSCVLRTQCCQCLWIVHSWLPPRFSLMFICPMSAVLNVDSVSGLSILDGPLGFL